MIAVDLKESNGCPTFFRHADQHRAIPAEVISPIMRPRIEKKCFVASCWIYRGNVWTFVVIAEITNVMHAILNDIDPLLSIR